MPPCARPVPPHDSLALSQLSAEPCCQKQQRVRLSPLASVVSSTLFFAILTLSAAGQSTSILTGRVLDPSNRVIANAEISVYNHETGAERLVRTNNEGIYEFPALPVGSYRLTVRAAGFRPQIIEVTTTVASTFVQDVLLTVSDRFDALTVVANPDAVESTTISVGSVIDQRTVQDVPLNGRHFLDLALLIPGSVTPPQSGFSTTPSRGLGALAINTAGNREETVNYLINGITLNNLTFSSISFQPSISTIEEFKMYNSTFSAEYGESSGAVVNIATRSGGNEFHGEAFEFLRNDELDARNFFNFTSSEPPAFKRNQFGGSVGGPILKDRAFFFVSYEGLRQRQEVDLNSIVLSDAERASVADPVIARLIEFIPRANFVDGQGLPHFVGSAPAPSDTDQWTIDIGLNLTNNDRLHGFYDFERASIGEPNRAGNTIPGFGHNTLLRRQIFTLSETHIAGPNFANEARFGFNRIYGTLTPNMQINPTDIGIKDGNDQAIGLPQMSIAGGALNFGGPALLPAGRGDTTFIVSDSLSCLSGNHLVKIGGEYRQFLNNNFAQDTGQFNFPSIAASLADTADFFSVTLGNRTSSIAQGALGFFAQDNYKWRPNLTLELGLRYDWNMTPTERHDRFIVFDPAGPSLQRLSGDIYHQNNKNFAPRVGFAWDPFRDGRTSVRAAYGIYVDQPMTSVVTGTATNPPLATPLTFAGSISLANAINVAQPAGLSPLTVDPGFDNAYLQSWNLSIQRELSRDLMVMVGYFGSKGTHLITRRNINQPVDGERPFLTLSESSPILPGTPLGNITQAESTGNSSYNALWVTAQQRISHGLQFQAYYAWSKSLDYSSLSSEGVVVQNSYDLRGDHGLSDFDVRHRFVVSAIYELPFRGTQFVEGWQLAGIVQVQSGNPVNVVSSDATVNGVPFTLRPDAAGSIKIIGDVDQWFDTSAFVPVARFGDLGRNVVIGPPFDNFDFSVIKNTNLRENMWVQFRAEFFDIFNHPNFGQPGNVIGSPTFGRITQTRFPTGESGSSRQIQFALKFKF